MRVSQIVCIGMIAVFAVAGLGLAASGRPVRAATPAAPGWSAVGSMSTPRSGATATALEDGTGRVLIAGGDVPGSELFDPASAAFAATGEQQEIQNEATATLLASGHVLLVGGKDGSGTATHAVELYDPQTGKWSAAMAMSTARWGHTATMMADGRVLVSGGTTDGVHPLASASIYDPLQNMWSAPMTMGTARYGHAAGLLKPVTGCPAPGCSRVLVVGGALGADPSGMNYTANSEIYDTRVPGWIPAGSLTVPRAHLTATVLPDGRVLAAGGLTCIVQATAPSTCKPSVSDNADLMDPSSGAWTPVASATGGTMGPRYSHTALLTSGRADATVLVAGGSDGTSALSSSAIFDPVAGKWSAGPPLQAASIGPAAAIVNGLSLPSTICPDALLIAGGTGGAGDLQSAELFDAQPWISGLTPSHGPAGGQTTVAVTGGGLGSVVSSTLGPVISGGSTSLNIGPTRPEVPDQSPVPVGVATQSCQSRPWGGATFTYDQPTVTAVTPYAQASLGNVGPVTVSGTNFVPGVTSVSFGSASVPAAGVTLSSTDPTHSLTVTPPPRSAADPSTVDVRVTTGSVQSAIDRLRDPYTYVPPPTITGLSWLSAPSQSTAGGDVVEIIGTSLNYVQKSTDGVFFGGAVTKLDAGSVNADGTEAFVTTPPHPAGTVGVWVVALGMSSVRPSPVTFTYVDHSAAAPPSPAGAGASTGAGAQPPQPPVVPAPPGGSAPGSSPANLMSGGYSITPGQSPFSSPGLNPVPLPSLLQLPGYTPVGAPGSSMPGASPATAAEGAPGVGQANPIGNLGMTDFTSGGQARYRAVSTRDPMLALVALMTILALGSAAAAWALRRHEPRAEPAAAWADS